MCTFHTASFSFFMIKELILPKLKHILLQRTLSGHKNIIRFVESSITPAPNNVYEVLILMQYCKGNLNEPPRGKTNNVVSDHVRHKPVCTVTEDG